jgi:hypothetical protein
MITGAITGACIGGCDLVEAQAVQGTVFARKRLVAETNDRPRSLAELGHLRSYNTNQ